MKDELLCISLIICSLIYFSIMSFQLIAYYKFKLLIKKFDMVSLLDSLYEITIFIVGFLYLGIFISSIADVFLNMNQFANRNIPFIIYAMPLMGITFRILVNQGLFAYNSSTLYIGSKTSITKENVRINRIHKYRLMNRAKIIISIDSDFIVQEKKYVIRTSFNNLQSFMSSFGNNVDII